MNNEKQIRVLMVDDHTVVRRGLIFVLQAFDDIQPVVEAASIEEALKRCQIDDPDVVLMDVKMVGETDGIIATQKIRERFPDIEVLILSSFFDGQMVTQAIQAGARGYLLKDTSTDELARAIRLVSKGKMTLAPEAAEAMMGMHQSVDPVGKDLTDRQLEVLGLLVKGMTNQEIAQVLNITPYTARHHVSEILAKLHATNRAEAAAIAIKKGLVIT
jgi:NarL family two-component system response regulator LiaR